MAKLSAFSRNKARVTEGEKIEVGPEGDTFFIVTRGFLPSYRDTLYDLRLEAARRLNRSLKPGAVAYGPESLPPSEEDKCQGKAIARECVLGVEGLEREDGGDYTVDEFRALLESGDYPVLTSLAISAAGRVGDDRAIQNADAVGNSQPPSNGN